MAHVHGQIVLFDAFDPLDAIPRSKCSPLEATPSAAILSWNWCRPRPREVVSGTRDVTLKATHALDAAKPGM